MAIPTNDCSDPADSPVSELVADWLSLDEAAEQLSLSTTQVRRLVREGDLVAVPVAGRRGPQLPALFITQGEVVKGIPGTLRLLADARYTPEESLGWLFSHDPSLPGRPIDALRENRGGEVRRRAQAMR